MEINLDEVVTELQGRGVPAYVEQTGGGVATVYVDPDDLAGILIGPGWFEGPGWTNPRGQVDELYIGPDLGTENSGLPGTLASDIEDVDAARIADEAIRWLGLVQA